MGQSEILSVHARGQGTRRCGRGLVLLLSIAGLAPAATCPTQPYQNAALLIAVSNPSLPEGPRPLKFAGQDVDRLQPIFQEAFGRANVFKLKDAEATTAGVSVCLDDLVKYARSGSKVVIFISARGFASSDMNDGYILTADAAIDKVPSTKQWQAGNGISIQTLRRKMAMMPQARERYLLLDLCREPEETPNLDNLINRKILDRRFLDAANTRRIILASSGSQRSRESYYADALTEILSGNPSLVMEMLFTDLKMKVKQKSKSKQTPDRPAPAPNDGWDRCLLCKLSRLPGPLVASLTASAMFFQIDPPAASPEETQRKNEAIAAEEEGQRVFVRYGEGNHFHGDPFHQCENAKPEFQKFKLCREEYSAAAEKFEKAAKLYKLVPTGDSEEDRIRQAYLLERVRFCRAQVRLLGADPAGAQVELQNPENFQLAESHNLLGISYLEQARYADAEKQFRLAIVKAPHWGYPRHNLALALVEHGDYTAAEREYRDAIQKTPVGEKAAEPKNPCFGDRSMRIAARPYLYYNLGVLLQRLNRLGEAQKQYCLAQVSFRLQLGMLETKSDEDDAGRELAGLRSQAARINLADANNSLAVLLETRKKHDRAREQLAQALANNPELSAARFNVVRLDANRALARGDRAEAQKLYQKLLSEPFCQRAERDLGCQAAEAALERLRRERWPRRCCR